MNITSPDSSASPIAVASIIAAMGLIAIGNGMMFSFIPIRLHDAGFDPSWAGAILAIMSLGSLAGCMLTNRIVRRVGHARAHMVFSALIILSSGSTALAVMPELWLLSRLTYGFAIAALFIISQSWLNDVVGNQIRGRVMAIFYVTYLSGLGLGSLLLTGLDVSGNMAPLVATLLGTVSILPTGLTRLPLPQPPSISTISFKRAWAISPVGVISMLAVGGMSMLAGGYTPIHLAASGYSKNEIALLMFALPFGTMLIQLPAGWISDRTDRRFVLAGCALIAAVAGSVCAIFDGTALIYIALFFVLWDGATESIYSIGNAHAGDKARKEDLVELSSTMLFTWSVAGFVVPAITTVLTSRYGTAAYFPMAIAIALMFTAFVLLRIARTGVQLEHKHAPLAPHGVGAPASIDLT